MYILDIPILVSSAEFHNVMKTCYFYQCIYGKPGGPLFTTSACTAVLHHSQNPDFCDEVSLIFLSLNVCQSHMFANETEKYLYRMLLLQWLVYLKGLCYVD